MSLLLTVPTIVRSATAWRATWETALANVATAPARILAIGDSVTEGQGAATKAARWTDTLTAALQTNYPSGATGGVGWVPADTYTYGPDSPWKTYTSTSGVTNFVTDVGNPGFRALALNNNATVTYTVTGTSVDLYWVRDSGGGTFTYAVNGGSATTVSTAGARSTTTKTNIALGSSGTYTILITATASNVTISGLMVFRGDETKGVQMWEAGHSAWTSSNYINNAQFAEFTTFVGTIAPDLVTVQLGLNDYGGGIFGGLVSSSAYQTNLQTLLTMLEGLPKSPSILIIDSYDFPVNEDNAEPQSAYRAVLLSLVSANPDKRGYLDFGVTMPPTDTVGTPYYRTDLIHPNDTGHAEIERQVQAALTPPVAPGPTTAYAIVHNSAYRTVGPLATESFAGTTGAAWPSQWTTNAGSGAATIQTGWGRLTVNSSNFTTGSRAYLSGMTDTDDTDVLVTLRWSQPTVEQYTQIAVRYNGTWDDPWPSTGYHIELNPNGRLGYFKRDNAVGSRTTLANAFTIGSAAGLASIAANTSYKARLRVLGAVYSFRIWLASATEPTTWDLQATDGTPYTAAGKVNLDHGAGTGTTNNYVEFDDLLVSTGTLPPEAIPDQVTGLTATAGPGTVTLNWEAQPTATQGFNIYRDSVLVGAAAAGATSYVDTGMVPGTTYLYRVSGLSTAGEGVQSAQVSATPSVVLPTLTWPQALATASSTPAVWLAIGDSVTEGQGASVRANRWIDLARDRFRAAAGITGGGQGSIGGHYRVYTPDSTWAATGIATSGTSVALSNVAGFGYRARSLGGANAQITWTVTGTHADLWYRRASGAGTFTWAVDGGTTTSVNTANTTTDWQRISINLGTAGSHTVQAARTAGVVVVGNLQVYNGDSTNGVHLYDAGSTTITTREYLGNEAFESGTPDYTNFKAAVATIAPDLVTIELGLNDGSQSILPAEVTTNLTTMVRDLQALAAPPHIVLIAAYTPSGYVTAAPWAQYVTAMAQLATTYGLGFLNLSALMPDATLSGTGFYSTDGLHPNDSGHARIAALVVEALFPVRKGPVVNPSALVRAGSW